MNSPGEGKKEPNPKIRAGVRAFKLRELKRKAPEKKYERDFICRTAESIRPGLDWAHGLFRCDMKPFFVCLQPPA
jgi:hypothetical protein